MTSLMTSPGHKVSQILILIYLRQYLRYSVDQKVKISEILIVILLVKHPVKSLARPEDGDHFENFEILNTAAILP